jgi:hypothetical protein
MGNVTHRLCHFCGELFTPRVHNAKYCGSTCCGRAFRAARAAKRRPCSVGGCENPAVTRGWCNNHYQRWLKHGDPTAGNKSPAVIKAIDYPDGTRLCTKCDHRLPIEQFAKDGNASGGRRSQCKKCRCAHEKSRYQSDPDWFRQKQAERRRENIELHRMYDNQRYLRDRPKRIALAVESSHRRRKRVAESERVDRGISTLALRKRDGSRCHICKRTMDFKPGKKGEYKPLRASIEHLTPISQGGLHIWENVVLTCLACNLARPKKNDPGGEQLLLIG